MNNPNSKTSIMCIYFILKKYSDENHILSTNRILDILLEDYNINMDRRAVYRNIQALQSIGVDIGSYKDNGEGYYLISRDFDVFDIRLLCDAIASSEMLSSKDSNTIIKKLIGTLSIYDGRMLEKTVYIKNNKTLSGYKIFYTIDTLLIAINQGVKISIKLLKTDYKNNRVLCDEIIILNPYATIWTKGNYYVIGKEDLTDTLNHYRIDNIGQIDILERSSDSYYGRLNIQEYTQKQILNNGQHPITATIIIPENLWNNLTESFEEITVLEHSKNTLKVRIKDIKDNIKNWIMNNLEFSTIIQPEELQDEIKLIILKKYKEFFE